MGFGVIRDKVGRKVGVVVWPNSSVGVGGSQSRNDRYENAVGREYKEVEGNCIYWRWEGW